MARPIAEEDGHQGAEGRRRDERAEDLLHSHIGNAVALMLVAIEEAVLVAKLTEHVYLADGDELECEGVQNERGDGAHVTARVGGIRVVDCERDGRVHDHPAVHLPVGHIGHLVLLRVHRHLAVEVDGQYVQRVVDPVVERPLAPVQAPSGLHRVFRVGLGYGLRALCPRGIHGCWSRRSFVHSRTSMH